MKRRFHSFRMATRSGHVRRGGVLEEEPVVGGAPTFPTELPTVPAEEEPSGGRGVNCAKTVEVSKYKGGLPKREVEGMLDGGGIEHLPFS